MIILPHLSYIFTMFVLEIEYRFGWNIKCYMPFSNPPCPIAQTTYGRMVKFGMERQWGNTFGVIREFSISALEQRYGGGVG